jgi:hypothetical protein
VREYLCEVCLQSLEEYTASMAGAPNPTIAWWRRQAELRDSVRRQRDAAPA